MSDLQDALGSPIAMAQAFMVGFQLRGEAESWPESTMTEIANVIETLEFQVNAARRVANGERIWICEYPDRSGDQKHAYVVRLEPERQRS